MSRRRTTRARPRRRAGLAPLELVLSLPLLLFVMALMINFGTMASWKVRAQGNARHAGWRTLELRTGQSNPHPVNWPAPASLSGGGGAAVVQVDPVWNGDVNLRTPAVRGPVIVAPQTQPPRSIAVDRELEMSRGTHDGNARIERSMPLLRGILRNNGRYTINLHQNVLDGRWEFHNLGFGDNVSRRAKQWYRLEPDDFPVLQPLVHELREAHRRLRLGQGPLPFNPFHLDPLDRDDEFIRYQGRAPDFHPHPGVDCLDDPGVVHATLVDPLVGRIRRLPGRMASAFIGMYQREIDRLQAMMPPPPGAAQTIAELEQKIEELRVFLNSIPPQHR